MNLTASALMATLGAAALLIAPPGAHHRPTARRSVTYADDVAPILDAKCVACHHPGEVAPFSLSTYRDAKAKAPTIAAVTGRRYMPPWQAVDPHGMFSNERTLTSAEVEILSRWNAEGAPAGNLAQAPKPPTFDVDWLIGKPDFTGEPAQAYAIGPEGQDEYRCFVVPTHFSEDRYVTEVELRPGNRKVVHHILVYIDTSGQARKLDGRDGKPGYASFGGPGIDPAGTLGGWAPGLQPLTMPSGAGMLLPKGADIVLQVHYHRDGKPERDLSAIGLKFATKPVDKKVRWQSVGNVLMNLPVGAKRSEVTADMTLSTPVTLLDVIPHMHLLGHDMRVTATLPNGRVRELIHVEDYDFNWQTRYIYSHPVKLPSGTHIQLVAHYDNSADNPRNPNMPLKAVHFGEQTTDEMCFAFFSFTLDDEHLLKGEALGDRISDPDKSATFSRLFDSLDTARQGWLGKQELTTFAERYGLGASLGPGQSPASVAAFILRGYGKAQKERLSKTEFIRMANQFSN